MSSDGGGTSYYRNLDTFLYDNKTTKSSSFTHTSIGEPKGKFYIRTEDQEQFFKLYKESIKNGDTLYMTEKHKDQGPFLIDIDFKFTTDVQERKYTNEDIIDILKIYCEEIEKYINNVGFKIYVMEKSRPKITDKHTKDGIHIVIPDIVTKPYVQLIIRQNVLPKLENIFQKLECTNSKEDIVDECVIMKNAWQMYMSTKPSCEPYKITKIYEYKNGEDLEEKEIFEDHTMYIETMSIRNKVLTNNIKDEYKKEVETFEKKVFLEEISKKTNNIIQKKINTNKAHYNDLEEVKKLLRLLNKKRTEDYMEWMRIGWCLHNIDHRLLESWIDFSKLSKKYKDGQCERLWNYMSDGSLGIGSLKYWAKQDNPEEYKRIISEGLISLLKRSVTSKTDFDIASVVYSMFKDDFKCTSIKNNTWYYFNGHRWNISLEAHHLQMKITNEIRNLYTNYGVQVITTSTQEGLTTEERDDIHKSADKYFKVAKDLGMVATVNNIVKMCKHRFYDDRFESELDSNPNLICFENGVYDLELGEFRDGIPDDKVSYTTGINYIPFDEKNESLSELDDFLNKVFTKIEIKEYVLTLLASFLNGTIKEERFHIWTGSGANGKSKCVELFEKAFGSDYCCKMPITTLTQKRTASNQANSEIARTKGKRFAVLQEPGDAEKLNIGYMKELTGGDKIMARSLYKEPIDFKPQFKMVLTCNHLPQVPSDDGGTWRRIRVVAFESKFMDKPNKDNPNEFLIDTDLSNKMNDWTELFMAMLIEKYYKIYKDHGLSEPDEVLACTQEYQRKNDIVKDFYEDCYEEVDDESSVINSKDIFRKFKEWALEENIPLNAIKKKELTEKFEKIVKKDNQIGNKKQWKNYREKSDEDELAIVGNVEDDEGVY